jgi:hypothetical protein
MRTRLSALLAIWQSGRISALVVNEPSSVRAAQKKKKNLDVFIPFQVEAASQIQTLRTSGLLLKKDTNYMNNHECRAVRVNRFRLIRAAS